MRRIWGLKKQKVAKLTQTRSPPSAEAHAEDDSGGRRPSLGQPRGPQAQEGRATFGKDPGSLSHPHPGTLGLNGGKLATWKIHELIRPANCDRFLLSSPSGIRVSQSIGKTRWPSVPAQIQGQGQPFLWQNGT